MKSYQHYCVPGMKGKANEIGFRMGMAMEAVMALSEEDEFSRAMKAMMLDSTAEKLMNTWFKKGLFLEVR